jgi:ferredoxin
MLPNGSAAIVVECWKVPQAVSGSAALRVPCLGGIIQSHLLALAVAGRRPIQFIDRGWCAHCRAGGGDGHPAQRLVDGANALFDACGWFQDARIRLVTDALPLGLMPEDIPDAATQARLGRRAFFRRLTTELVRSVSPQAQFPRVSAGTLRRRGVSPLPERDSVLDVVGEMARTQGRPLPTSLFPALQMSDVCRHHGVCAGVCPTGALRVHERNDAGGVDFDAAACLACGLCIDSCPEGAISFATRQSTPSRDLPERLTRHPWRICPDCLRDYPGAESDERCPNCEKRRELARNLFGPFFAKPVSNNLFFSTGGKHHE